MLSFNLILAIATFGLVASGFILIAMLLGGPKRTAEDSIAGAANLRGQSGVSQDLSRSSFSSSVLPALGTALMPEDKSKLSRLTARLRQAGLYQRHTTVVYMGTKFILMIAPMLVGIGLSALGMVGFIQGILLGAAIGLVGTIVPGLWLRNRKKGRQRSIRRAMPDALDVIVICMEGGLSLPASLSRVASELSNAHPLLASEMSIVQREIQLGRSAGDALRQFSDRFDIEELRSLSSVVLQSERFGAGIVQAMRVHADTLRLKRYQHAEAQAQKAPVKLVFPTVLCIFPALYIVLMGPAGVELWEMLKNLS